MYCFKSPDIGPCDQRGAQRGPRPAGPLLLEALLLALQPQPLHLPDPLQLPQPLALQLPIRGVYWTGGGRISDGKNSVGKTAEGWNMLAQPQTHTHTQINKKCTLLEENKGEAQKSQNAKISPKQAKVA